METIFYVIPGFISYILLRPFGIFNFYDNFDRQVTLVILSLINSGITAWLVGPNHLWKTLLASVLITVVYFVIFSYYPKFSQMVANKLNVVLYDEKSTMESIINEEISQKHQVYAISFDFENNFISSGYVKNIDNDKNYQIGLYDSEGEKVWNIDDARAVYSESNKNSLVTDIKNNIKTYLIIS